MKVDNVSCCVANSSEKRNEIFKFRYKIYLSEGAISENPQQTLVDDYDVSGKQLLCGLYQNHSLIGSVRLHLIECSNSISPAKSVFPDEISKYSKSGIRILDPNRLCLHRTDEKGSNLRLMSLLRIPFMAAQYLGVDYVTATSRPEHMKLYGRIFGGKMIAEPKTYPTMLLPHGLMISDFKKNQSDIMERIPSFRSDHAERKELFDDFKDWSIA